MTVTSPLAHRSGERVITGWGRTCPSVATMVGVRTAEDVQAAIAAAGPRGLLARGLGRSYGDAAQSGGATVLDREVQLTGFVTPDPAGGWWLARQSMSCCAADAQPVRVKIAGAPDDWAEPAAETWVTVTGTWLPENLAISGSTVPIPTLAVSGIEAIEPPASPYE